MKICPDVKEDFEPYKRPLQALENAFKEAGLEVEFGCEEAYGVLLVVPLYSGGRVAGMVPLNGDSPAQAVKNVANAIRVSWDDIGSLAL